MKYSFRFYNYASLFKDIDEIILKYNKTSLNLPSYISENYTNGQRIVLDIREYSGEDFLTENEKIFSEVIAVHDYIAIKMNMEQLYLVEGIKDMGIDFFLDTKIDTLDKLLGVVNLGVSDVYICNELGFMLKDVSTFCHYRQIKVRVYPNVAQSSTDLEIEPFKKFFIRPEDLHLYEEYVDIIEFYCKELDKQMTLYEIYHKDKSWNDDLSIIILGLDKNLINSSIPPIFGEVRLNCKKNCGLNRCDICGKTLSFLKMMKRVEEESGKRLIFDVTEDK